MCVSQKCYCMFTQLTDTNVDLLHICEKKSRYYIYKNSFTRSYSRYNKGTGSVLYVPNQDKAMKRQKVDENGVIRGIGDGGGEGGPIAERVLPEDREFDNEWKAKVFQTGNIHICSNLSQLFLFSFFLFL
jgi:aspartate/tyrosine/aromatic aminotransferase